MKFEYAEQSLSDLFFRVSSPSHFNDPFECRGRYINFAASLRKYVHDNYQRLRFESIKNTNSLTPDLQNRFTEEFLYDTYFASALHSLDSAWLNAIDKVVFMLCFVKEKRLKPASDVLFWSHYADGGAGIRISFDLPSTGPNSLYCVKEVEYQDIIPVLDCREMPDWLKGAAFQTYVERLSYVKGKAWEYENEVRMILPRRAPSFLQGKRYLQERKGTGGVVHSFVQVAPETIRRVDFGPRVTKDAAEGLLTRMKQMGVYSHVKFYQVGFDDEKYQYTYQRIS